VPPDDLEEWSGESFTPDQTNLRCSSECFSVIQQESGRRAAVERPICSLSKRPEAHSSPSPLKSAGTPSWRSFGSLQVGMHESVGVPVPHAQVALEHVADLAVLLEAALPDQAEASGTYWGHLHWLEAYPLSNVYPSDANWFPKAEKPTKTSPGHLCD
jgi:hypothetical protein